MKKSHLAVIFIVTIFLWISSLVWMPVLAVFVKLRLLSQIETSVTLAELGTLGDTFEATTSLFSGLGLVAVALTLWLDLSARRRARKPLVIFKLDSNSAIFSLDEPVISNSKRMRFVGEFPITNSSDEIALNINIGGLVSVGVNTFCVFDGSVDVPLAAGQTIDFSTRSEISGENLDMILFDLTKDGSHVIFSFSAEYESIEGVKWKTLVKYEVHCPPEHLDRLNSVRSNSPNFSDNWRNREAVGLQARVVKGSWKHCEG